MRAISAILGKGYCGESAESLRGRGGTCANLLYGITVTNGNLAFPYQNRPDADDGHTTLPLVTESIHVHAHPHQVFKSQRLRQQEYEDLSTIGIVEWACALAQLKCLWIISENHENIL